MKTMTPRPRDAWMDIAKGIGIVLVVFGHVVIGLTSAGILPPDGPISQLNLFIYTFHMPLFFFLAGLTVERSLAKGTQEFLKTKLFTIAYPYFVWSIIQGLSQTLASDSLNAPFKVEYILSIYVSPIGHFWFLYVLMAFHLIAALVKDWKYILIAIAIVLLLSRGYLYGLYNIGAYQFLYYAAGVVLWRHVPSSVPDWKYAFVAGLGALALAAVTAFGIGPYAGWSYWSTYMAPAAALGISAVVLISHIPPDWAVSKVAAYLGRLSLSIYLMHVMACAGIRIVLMKLGVIQDPALYLISGILAGILLPLAAHEILGRLRLLEVFGLERPRARPRVREAL